MTFPARLTELLEKATKGPWYADGELIWRRHPKELYQYGGTVAGDKPILNTTRGWYGEGESGYPSKDNTELIAYLVNHAEAIRDLVVAAEIMCGQAEGDDLEAEANMVEALAKLEEA